MDKYSDRSGIFRCKIRTDTERQPEMIETERMALLTKALESKVERAELLGIKVGIYVENWGGSSNTNGQVISSYNPHERVQAASINKLAVVSWAIEHYGASKEVIEWSPSDQRAGGGYFDQDESMTSANLVQLVHDAIALSGNTATKMLGKDHGEDINRYLEQSGLNDTQVAPLSDGSFETGFTSAYDAAMLIKLLVNPRILKDESTEPNLLNLTALEALQISVTPSRPYITAPLTSPILLAKSGELNPPDSNVFLRHEAGLLGRLDNRSINYAILTQSQPADDEANKSEKLRAMLRVKSSKWFVGQMVAEMAGNLGHPAISIGRVATKELSQNVLRRLPFGA